MKIHSDEEISAFGRTSSSINGSTAYFHACGMDNGGPLRF